MTHFKDDLEAKVASGRWRWGQLDPLLDAAVAETNKRTLVAAWQRLEYAADISLNDNFTDLLIGIPYSSGSYHSDGTGFAAEAQSFQRGALAR